MSPDAAFPARQAQRLAQLFGIQGERRLTAEEQHDLDALIDEYGRRRHATWVQERARETGRHEADVEREFRARLADIRATLTADEE